MKKKPSEVEVIAMAIVYGVYCKAADEPGHTPQSAWEEAKPYHDIYLEDARAFLRALRRST